ncbi:MAG: ComEC/Rec2 family competence protein [Salibacteraceae bacterium]
MNSPLECVFLRLEALSQIPLLRLLLPLTAGILLGIARQRPMPNLYWLLLCLGLALLLLYSWERWRQPLPKFWRGLLVYPAFAIAGYLLAIARIDRLQPSHFQHHIAPHQWVIGEVMEPPMEKRRSIKVVLSVREQSDSLGNRSTVSGKALLYLAKEERSLQLRYGDQLLLRPRFQEIAPPANPAQFNYRRFLSFEQIHQQSFVPANDWRLLQKGGGAWWFRVAYGTRERLLERFEKLGIAGAELAVLSALMLVD